MLRTAEVHDNQARSEAHQGRARNERTKHPAMVVVWDAPHEVERCIR